jgi:hypothetical protein
VPEFRKPAVGEVAEVLEEAPIGTIVYQVKLFQIWRQCHCVLEDAPIGTIVYQVSLF